jgi:chromosomal replication initiator protein
MPNFCRQISEPGAAATGEAWMRICRRLRLELGEDVFSSWFGCVELDALSGEDACLSVPTKFLKSRIQSHYTDKILQALASEFSTIKRVSVNVRSSTRPAAPERATGGHLDPAPSGDADSVRDRNVTFGVLCTDGDIRPDNAIFILSHDYADRHT